MGWRNRPKNIDEWPKNVDYIMFIDENGDSDLTYVKKCKRNGVIPNNDSIFFTITGVIINKKNLNSIKDDIMNIKCKYWNEGYYEYKNNKKKRVCFHSREIRRKEEAFFNIDYSNFIMDLSCFMRNVPCKIMSSTINKFQYINKDYPYTREPYDLCLIFILERLVKYYLKSNESVAIVLESRGKKEDKKILEYMKRLIDQGTTYADSNLFKKIKGVYFNPKWQSKSNCKKSYFGLEIADLYSYPIHKYCKLNKKDKAFKTFENKVYSYPNYDGYGIKIFPK